MTMMGDGGGWGGGGVYNVWFWSRNLKARNDFLVVLRSICPYSVRHCYFLITFDIRKKRKKKIKIQKKDEMMFGFWKNKLLLITTLCLKKDIEEVVKCFIISMYLNTIILLQYCWCHSGCSCLNGYDIVMFLDCWVYFFHSFLKIFFFFYFQDAKGGLFLFFFTSMWKCMSNFFKKLVHSHEHHRP